MSNFLFERKKESWKPCALHRGQHPGRGAAGLLVTNGGSRLELKSPPGRCQGAARAAHPKHPGGMFWRVPKRACGGSFWLAQGLVPGTCFLVAQTPFACPAEWASGGAASRRDYLFFGGEMFLRPQKIKTICPDLQHPLQCITIKELSP